MSSSRRAMSEEQRAFWIYDMIMRDGQAGGETRYECKGGVYIEIVE